MPDPCCQHIELRALEKGYLQAINVDEGQVVKGQIAVPGDARNLPG